MPPIQEEAVIQWLVASVNLTFDIRVNVSNSGAGVQKAVCGFKSSPAQVGLTLKKQSYRFPISLDALGSEIVASTLCILAPCLCAGL